MDDALLVAQEDLFTPRILAGHSVPQNLDANGGNAKRRHLRREQLCAFVVPQTFAFVLLGHIVKAAAIATWNGSDNSGRQDRAYG
jgi:hypothetical protein